MRKICDRLEKQTGVQTGSSNVLLWTVAGEVYDIFRLFSQLYLNNRQTFLTRNWSESETIYALFKATRLHWHKQSFYLTRQRNFMTLWIWTNFFKTPKSHNNTNKLTDWGSRPETSVFCEVKILFLSLESGGFKESTDSFTFSSVFVVNVCLTAT